MSHDILRDAARALRETSSGGDECAKFTRARVLRAVRDRGARRRKLGTILLPFAAVLVVSSAWAGATGRFPEIVRQVKHAIGIEPKAAEPTPPAPARAVVAAAAPKAEPAPAPVATPEPIETATAEPEKVLPAKPEPVKAAAAKAPRAEDPADALYRAAHTAHFVRHDAAAALGAWDAYLAAAPRGRFSLEARYNRALCLTRLGRTSEARAALEPFARGAFGNYRKDEASELLDALGH
jgi:hypothetical protein